MAKRQLNAYGSADRGASVRSVRARESAPWTMPNKRVARDDPSWRPKLTVTQSRELKARGLENNETYWQRRRDKMKHADAIKGL